MTLHPPANGRGIYTSAPREFSLTPAELRKGVFEFFGFHADTLA
jgi:hypothetical protein